MMDRVALGMVAILAAASPALADWPDGPAFSHMSGGYGFGMFLGPVFMLVLLAALVVGIVALIRWMMPGENILGGKSDAALSALNLRFANGEIDAKEYAERKKLLIT